MISVFECQRRAGLRAHELVLGVSPTRKHEDLLSSYLYSLKRGERFVLKMIVADLRRFLDLGALESAADVLIALRYFLRAWPTATVETTAGKKLVDRASRVGPFYPAHALASNADAQPLCNEYGGQAH